MRLLILLLGLLLPDPAAGLEVEPPNIKIDPSNPNLQYSGRWNFEHPSAPWCVWPGSSLVARFKGREIAITLETASRDHATAILVIVNDDQANAIPIVVRGGTHEYLLATDLPEREHKVELVRTAGWLRFTVRNLRISGTGLVPPAPRPKRRLTFYSDSSFGSTTESNELRFEWDIGYYAATGIASRMLTAEHHNISVENVRLQDMMQNYWDRYGPNPGDNKRWDFSRYTPDAIIVLFDFDTPPEYEAFLDTLRTVQPSAHIVFMCTPDLYGTERAGSPCDFLPRLVEQHRDDNVSVLQFPWIFGHGHGTQYDQSGIANTLARHLEKILGWSYKPSDVMDGFGRNGDVANGSFESVAPFGGYGWRYAQFPTDRAERKKGTRVRRIDQALDAPDGRAYLRLARGARTHQANPASDGDRIDVRLWARGSTERDVAAVTIDFRDRVMWSDPVDTHTDTLRLTAEWKEYQLTASTPPRAERVIWHTRLTLEAGAGSMVDFDAIEMMTTSASGRKRQESDDE